MTENASSNSVIKQVTVTLESLKLNENESQTSVLIGDDFERNLAIENLTLPNRPAAILLAEVTQQDAVDPSDPENTRHLYQNLPFALTNVVFAKMISLNRLTSGESKVVYEACLHLPKGEQFNYKPGDSIGIVCENSDQDVNWILDHIDLESLGNPDTKFIIQPISQNVKSLPNWFVPQILVTARILLTYCCDIHIPVTRRLIRLCADFCSSERERIRLLELASRQGHQMFEMLIGETNMTLPDLFGSFPSIRLPLMRLVEILPRLQPRAYSLINLPNILPGLHQSEQELRFMFTRVDFPDLLATNQPAGLRRYPGRIHGTCTGWLERLWNKTSVQASCDKTPRIGIYLRNNLTNFRMPENSSQPVIMIGAGTGLAPFLSFIKSRESLHTSSNTSRFGPLWLIFGCRSSKTSLLHKEYLLHALENKILHHLCLCFSRECIRGGVCGHTNSLLDQACLLPNTHYVQDCLTFGIESQNSDHARQLVDLILNRNAKIMVCGEPKTFATSVQEACSRLVAWGLRDPNLSELQLSETELELGRTFVKQMQTDKRYQVDIWI